MTVYLINMYGEPKYSEINLTLRHFVNHRHRPKIEFAPSPWKAGASGRAVCDSCRWRSVHFTVHATNCTVVVSRE